jgi:hypothetical protein
MNHLDREEDLDEEVELSESSAEPSDSSASSASRQPFACMLQSLGLNMFQDQNLEKDGIPSECFFFVFHKQRAYQIRLIRACCLDITTRDLTPSSKLSWPALLKDQNATQKVNMSLKLRCLLHLLRQHGFFMASRIRSLFLPFAAAWDISPSSAVSMQRTWFKFKLLIVFITLDVDWIEELEDSDSQFDETASSDSPESESGAS